ncbi:serine/threonine-protein kinase [Geodermatophilus sp. SYSU D00766]
MDIVDRIRQSPKLESWDIGEKIGEGGMGIVYSARNKASGQTRAIKVMELVSGDNDELARARLLREIEICLLLRHPNIVRCEEGGNVGDIYFIIMERCEGGDLANLVRQFGPLKQVVAIPIAIELLDSLAYAHSYRPPVQGNEDDRVGVIHRDIKPQNILLSKRGQPRPTKLSDFGLAKAVAFSGMSGLTATGWAAGTPHFMPRQQIFSYKYPSLSFDVWSAAATLYFALTGYAPRDFPEGRDPWTIVTRTDVIPIRHRIGNKVTSAVARVIDAALDDRSDKLRYATAADLRYALQQASEHATPQ